MWHLKHHTNEPIYARESDSQTQRIDLCLLVGGGGLADANYHIQNG